MTSKRQLEIGGQLHEIETCVALDVEKSLLNFHRYPERSGYRVFYDSRTFPTLKGLRAICLDLHSNGRRKNLSGTAVFEGTGVEVPICKVVGVDTRDGSSFINFDSAQDGSWQLVYTKDVIKDIASIRRMKIVREELPEVDEAAFRKACQTGPDNSIDYVDAVIQLTRSLDGEALSLPPTLREQLSRKRGVGAC
jgi:hypothetical protein